MDAIRINEPGFVRDSGDPPLGVQIIRFELDGVLHYAFSSWRVGVPLKASDGSWSPGIEPARRFESPRDIAAWFRSKGWDIEWSAAVTSSSLVEEIAT
jgi:hypothetical protein